MALAPAQASTLQRLLANLGLNLPRSVSAPVALSGGPSAGTYNGVPISPSTTPHLYGAPTPDPDIGASAGLAVSPAWLAFRRSLGIEDATDAAEAQAKIDAVNRRAGLTRGDLLEQGTKQRKDIAGSYEARGLFRSGARLGAQADQQSGEARALSDIEAGLTEQISGLTTGLAGRQAARQRSSAEQGLNVADDESRRGY